MKCGKEQKLESLEKESITINNSEKKNDFNSERKNDYNSERKNDYNSERKNDYNSERKNDFNSERKNDYNSERRNNFNSERRNDYNSERRNDYDGKKYKVKILNLPKDFEYSEISEFAKDWGHIIRINVKNFDNNSLAVIEFKYEREANYFIEALDNTPFDYVMIKVLKIEE